MLHRAAANAYSWWWASHIRTKQSKWLEQNLVDMEEMVQSMMKIIEQEGDSFVKRVEMYYRKRPELIHFVEESYRAYRALAERYDHLSKDLQNANRTIATAFPEQIHLSMESDDDTSSHGSIPPSPDHHHSEKPLKTNIPSAPKSLPMSPRFPRIAPQFSKANNSALAAKKEHLRRTVSNSATVVPANSSGLTKEEAARQIDVLQKDILAMQTEKEFLKSSYETKMAKYWEIEGKIGELHSRVYNLQDEFGIGTVIQDHEARSFMATSALTSCSEALIKIQEEQEMSTNEVKGELTRIKDAHERLEALKMQINQSQGFEQDQQALKPNNFDLITGEIELEEGDSLRQKIREKLSVDCNAALTEPELADRIDELVQKIVILETTIFSQNGLLKRLRQYTDDILQNISNLEENKEMIAQNEENSKRVLELEEELTKVKSLNRELVQQKNNLNAELTEANCNLDHLMEKLEDVKATEEVETSKEAKEEIEVEHEVEAEAEAEKEVQCKEMVLGCSDIQSEHHHQHHGQEEDDQEEKELPKSQTENEVQDLRLEDKEDFSWRKVYTTNLEEREKIFVEEYTMILRDYKDNKIKLSEVEKKNREYIFDLTSLARELRSTIASKDEEIKVLVKKLNALQQNNKGNDGLELGSSLRTPKGKYHERSMSADEHRSPWAFDPDKKPLFHHLYDSETGIIARNTSVAESSPRKKENFFVDSPRPMSRVQARLRTELNNVLDGNLEFWLRFSTSFHQIQKFQATIKDLKTELSKLRDSKNAEGSNKQNLQALQSDARPIYKHLRETQTEMTLWMEHSSIFLNELRSRLSSLNNIQDEIGKLLNAGKRSGDPELSDFQAAKFQGEILNMKQENKKVEEELQAGIQRVKEFKKETEKVLVKLDREFKLSENKSKIPLHTILFGMKLKRNKHRSLALLG